MKQCTNVSCGYENPDEARFCKKCGTPISDSVIDGFTLDTFKGIQFMPVSVVKVSFVNNFLIVLWVLASIEDISYLSVIFCFIMFLINDLYSFYNWKRIQKKQG